jgi:hypothetical protein
MKDLPPGVHLVEDLNDFPDRFPAPDPRFVFNTSDQAASYRRVTHWATDLLSVRARCEGKERPIFPIIVVGSGRDTAVGALAETLPRGVEILSYRDREQRVFGFHAHDGTPAKQTAFYLIAR